MKNLIFENWRRFLNEEVEAKEVLASYDYCSIILTPQSQAALAKAVSSLKPEGWSDSSSAGDKKLCHHITINMGKSLKVSGYKHGQEIDINIVKYLEFKSEEGGIASVIASGLNVNSGNPHITVFLDRLSPGKAAGLKDVKPEQADKKTLIPTSKQDLSLQLKGIVNIPAEVA